MFAFLPWNSWICILWNRRIVFWGIFTLFEITFKLQARPKHRADFVCFLVVIHKGDGEPSRIGQKPSRGIPFPAPLSCIPDSPLQYWHRTNYCPRKRRWQAELAPYRICWKETTAVGGGVAAVLVPPANCLRREGIPDGNPHVWDTTQSELISDIPRLFPPDPLENVVARYSSWLSRLLWSW